MRATRPRLPRPRTFAARQAVRLAERWTGRRLLAIDHPPRPLGPRYGYGNPPHRRLQEILGGAEDAYARNLHTIAGCGEDLARVPAGPSATGPAWRNEWLPPLDAAALYGFIRDRSPRNYVEVGSGVSTRFARLAIDDGSLPTRITSIDPQPRSEIDAVCDTVVRAPLETVDQALFGALGEGDVLFMDGSHRVLTNSDATVFFLDVLPSLAAGVLVCVHDILLPDDYPAQWTQWHWSEQYLMGAYLLAGGDQVRLELAAHYVLDHSELHRILDPLWLSPHLRALPRSGFGLWFSTTNRRVVSGH